MRFFLISCLLILITACQKAREQSHAKVSIEKLQVKTLQERLANAAKPFVVVNFFDSQCKSCEMELPSLAELQKSESKEAEVVFISMDSTAEMRKKLPAFLAKQQIEKGVYEWEGKSESIQELYPDWDKSLPLTLLFNQKGELLEHLKVSDKSELEMLIQTHTLLPE